MDETAVTSIQESLNRQQRTGVVYLHGARSLRTITVKTTATIPPAPIHRIHGWLVSLTLHGLLLSAVLPLFRFAPLSTPSETFHWDVTLVQSTHPADELIQAADTIEQRLSIPTEPIPIPTKLNNTFQTGSSSTKRLTPSSPTTKTAVVTEPQLKNPSPIAPPVEQSSVAQATAPMQSNLAEEPTPSMSPAENLSPSALPTNDPSNQQLEPSIAPIIQEPSVPTTGVTSSTSTAAPASDFAQSTLSATDVATAPTQPRDTSPERSSLAPSEPSGQPSPPQTDYTWLQRAVSHRLEELKRSSRPFLDESSKLKVLVKAVVSSTGELMEAEVVKSSGLNRIDQEAMTLVQRAFPMPLDHALDRQQIVMRIPITYSRD